MAERDFLFSGPEQAPWTLLLAHGSGAPMDSPFLETIATGLGESGVRVARFEFPYMRERRTDGRNRPPDPMPRLQASFRKAMVDLRAQEPIERLAIGGKSLGGRVASLIADELESERTIDALVCLGYPFHPPNQPAKLRTEHLVALKTPTLVVQGDRDPFGTSEEVSLYALSRAIQIEWLGDGDHSWKPRKKSGRSEEQNLREGVESIVSFLRDLPRREPRMTPQSGENVTEGEIDDFD